MSKEEKKQRKKELDWWQSLRPNGINPKPILCFMSAKPIEQLEQ